jgi:hypothetical protein
MTARTSSSEMGAEGARRGVPALFFLFLCRCVRVGPPLIWLPAPVCLLYKGALELGLFLAEWDFSVVSSVDNVMRPQSRQQSVLGANVFWGLRRCDGLRLFSVFSLVRPCSPFGYVLM